jgi:5-methylcytosine-specific restriction endonuclease McrA
MKPYAYDLDERDLKRERQKARELRQSQWWKRRCAKGLCHYCGRQTPAGELTMDHIVPVARGGKSSKGNVVPACKSCNTKKKQLLPMEWEDYLQSFRLRTRSSTIAAGSDSDCDSA